MGEGDVTVTVSRETYTKMDKIKKMWGISKRVQVSMGTKLLGEKLAKGEAPYGTNKK